MRLLRQPRPPGDLNTRPVKGYRRHSDEREADIEMLQFLLASMKKRHAWDRIKCAVATAIPAFWILVVLARPYVPAVPSGTFPAWLAGQVRPLLEDAPAIWTIVISLAISGFQWYNLAYYQRRVIPLVREMYERALTRQDHRLLKMLGEALRFTTLRTSFRNAWQRLLGSPR